MGTRSIPLGFDDDPEVLYFASNGGRDKFGLYGLNLRTKKRTDFSVEDSSIDLADPGDLFSESVLVFDPYERKLVGARAPGTQSGTRWLDPEMMRIQERLESHFPARSVSMVDWDQTRSRFLVLVSSGADPGRYYLFYPSTDKLILFLRCAPWLTPDELNSTTPFKFETPAGVEIRGFLTMPRHPRLTPPPLIVYCHDGPSKRDEPSYNRDVQALAGMGFAVLQVNYRGSIGFGTAFRLAAQKDIGNTPAQDVLAAVDWTINHQRIDSKRLAILGEGFGGYVALRALQLRPEGFRAAISIDGLVDLNSWIKITDEATESRVNALEATQRAVDMTQRRAQMLSSKDSVQMMRDSAHAIRDDMFTEQTIADEKKGDFNYQFRRSYFGSDAARLDSISPALHPDSIKVPVFIIQNTERPSVASQSDRLRRALASHSIPRADLKINGDFDRASPEARTQVFAQIEEFLNLSVYDFGVKFGDLKIVR